MTPELWQRLKPLYEAAMETPAQKRARFVADACRGDSEARRELETLLARGEVGTDSLDRPFINFKDFWSPAQKAIPGWGADRWPLSNRATAGIGRHGERLRGGRPRTGPHCSEDNPAGAGQEDRRSGALPEELLAKQIGGPNVCRIHETA